MKLSDTLGKIADGSLMMRVRHPRTVSASTLLAARDRIEALEAQLDDAHRHMREAGLPIPRTTSPIGTSKEQGE